MLERRGAYTFPSHLLHLFTSFPVPPLPQQQADPTRSSSLILDSAAKIGRNSSILALAQTLVIEKVVALFAAENITLDWQIDRTLIADELARRIGKFK